VSWRERTVEKLVLQGPVAVLGDIHGRADVLARLLLKLDERFGRQIQILVVGDVVDRGPDTKGVLDLLVARGAKGVRGNHEEWFTAWACGEGFDDFCLHPAMGGRATLESYGVAPLSPRHVEEKQRVVPAAHRAWVEALPLALDLTVDGNAWWILHAGIPGRVSLADALDDKEGLEPADIEKLVPWLCNNRRLSLLWQKTWPEDMPAADRPVIFGHIPHTDVCVVGGSTCIDTGCGTLDGGMLTAFILPSGETIQSR
jgi:hypothetical protein